MDIQKLLRNDLKGFTPYKVADAKYKYKLDANESPFGMPESVRQRFAEWFENNDVNVYPDTNNTILRNTIGLYYNVLPENVTCGNGSDQMIDFITKALLEPDDVVVLHDPTFSMYEISTVINRGRIVRVKSDADFKVDEIEIVNAAKQNSAKIIFLCTPNNPNGSSLTEQQLKYVLDNVECAVVIDEAYGEFSDQSMIGYINEYKHMIILKTFSKIYGLAGLRVGYAIASEEMIGLIELVRPPYNLSAFAQVMASFVLQESGIYKTRRDIIMTEQKKLYEDLCRISWLKAYKSDANFVLIECDRDLAGLFKQNGILVRNIGELVRLTVGTEEQNRAVMEVIRLA